MPNKANFQNAKNERNSSNSNNYQQRTTNYKLLKTKPNKPNFYPPSAGKIALSEAEGPVMMTNPILPASGRAIGHAILLTKGAKSRRIFNVL
jgi:hypothetical protein